jgi:hypothetical protein
MVARRRLLVRDFGSPRPLPLERDDVGVLAGKWGDADSRRGRSWGDIEVLAALFLASDQSQPDATVRSWHHLLLAIGNFKRSGGLILPPALTLDASSDRDPDCCAIPLSPTNSVQLKRDCATTWRVLTDIVGFGVPTASTLLSALWPGSHVIVDRRAERAAIGISAGALWDVSALEHAGLPDLHTTDLYWEFYSDWYRPAVLATAEAVACHPVSVERALFCLHPLVRSSLPGANWVWTDYRTRAEDIIARLREDNPDQ